MNKKKISIGLNVLIVILEIVGMIICFKDMGIGCLLYYTQLSNIFLFIACILYLFKDRIKSRIVDIFKFGSSLSVLITFLVVLLVLGNITDLGYNWLFFEGANLYYHLLCPLLGIITFLFFDDIKISGFKDVFFAFTFTLIYTIVFIILNILKIVSGPYPFLLVYENPIYISLMWIVLIDGGALLLTWILERVKCKI